MPRSMGRLGAAASDMVASRPSLAGIGKAPSARGEHETTSRWTFPGARPVPVPSGGQSSAHSRRGDACQTSVGAGARLESTIQSIGLIGGGMLAATVVVLVLVLRAFYLNVKVGRMALIRRSGHRLLHVELRRCVYMEQLPAYISQFPVPREMRMRVLRFASIVAGGRQAASLCRTRPAPTSGIYPFRITTNSFRAGHVSVPW